MSNKGRAWEPCESGCQRGHGGWGEEEADPTAQMLAGNSGYSQTAPALALVP